MIKIDYSKTDEAFVKEHIESLYDDIEEDTDLSWLPLRGVAPSAFCLWVL